MSDKQTMHLTIFMVALLISLTISEATSSTNNPDVVKEAIKAGLHQDRNER